jgi:hypothetical protein
MTQPRGGGESANARGLAKEWIIYECERFKKELADEGDGTPERLYVGQGVMVWLLLNLIEQGYTNVWNKLGGSVAKTRDVAW